MKLHASKHQAPIGSLVVSELSKGKLSVSVEWTTGNTELDAGIGVLLNSDANIARYFARSCPELDLYGNNAQSKTEVDHWLTFTLGPLACKNEFEKAIQYLNSVLAPISVLVGDKLSIADYVVFGALYTNGLWQGFVESGKAPTNVLRWYEFVAARDEVAKVLKSLPADAKAKPETAVTGKAGGKGQPKQTKDEGKFVDLPGAEMGKVVVRFPPEASGYLHIGHAKAALLNQHYRDHFQGKLIMRFDDTNPAKEKEEYEEVILEDLKLLKVKYDHFSRTSDHFETIMLYCEKILKDGKAYVDDTDAETMKAQREAREESKNRNNPVAKNLELWEEMKKGSPIGLKCAVRAKMNMKSDNGCMRDPTIYRCKLESHPATKDKFKVYPTYDFACPVVDSIEGVTHALRTTEYMDRDEQFHWFIDAIGLRKPHIYAYARLNLTNTVMSKRKLTWFVDSGSVEGWDDPRFPTVRGVLRRGLTIEALKQFILAQGSSRSVVFMEWDKIWAMNKKVIDPVAPRYTTVDETYHVPVNIKGVSGNEAFKADLHPKDPAVGQKTVWRTPVVLIDGVDAETLIEGENATFINWGNLRIRKVNKKDGKVVSVDADANLDDKDFKKTIKLTWLGVADKVPEAAFTPTTVIYYDHIISKAVLDKDDDFKNFIGKNTKVEVQMLGDPELRKLKKGDVVQIQRRGFFIVDSPYKEATPNSCKPASIRLIAIPDGTPGSYGPPGKTPEPAAPSAKAVQKKGEAPKASAKLDSKPAPAAAVAPAAVSAKGSADDIDQDIIKQGDKVRELKTTKADKASVDAAVAGLLDLKAKYKAATGKDWKPGQHVSQGAAAQSVAAPAPAGNSGDELNASINAQGDKVRQLKTDKADKATVDAAVAQLLDLKAKYKAATGKDWKPGQHVSQAGATPQKAASPVASGGGADDLNASITAQGDKVRQLKSEKADKAAVEAAVAQLLDLKAKYKAATGSDWKPGAQPAKQPEKPKPAEAAKPASKESSPVSDQINDDIIAQGDKVRQLKSEKADKVAVDTAVQVLLGLKTKYKNLTGNDWKPPAGNPAPKQAAPAKKQGGKEAGGKQKGQQQKAQKEDKKVAEAGGQKQTRLGMEAKKEENLADWYSQVITKAEMLEYYDVSGCYILRPWAYSIWERIQGFFDGEIKKLGVQNCYFPIFVSQAALQKEKDHIADFAPEVAWVTKSGDTQLAEPIAIRPTSETVMYPAYAKWIQSYRDLPIKLNQWNNVVRWEFKHPQPFLRTREFLWQEGHTAFATQQEAKEEVLVILDLYRQIYEDLLAIPVIRGRKTEKEKFAGGDYTTTVEAYIAAAGRAIQGATSHHLGQNFSKMFELVYDHPETAEKTYVYQNSWGITTRTLGVLTMVHGDNKGMVLPPKVACIQAVIVPCGITVSLKDDERSGLYKACQDFEDALSAAGVRIKGDYRENYSPGWKFNHWELKGVPVRIEIGPRDVKSGQFVAVRRDTGDKITLNLGKGVAEIQSLLDQIQAALFQRATKELNDNLSVVKEWKDFLAALDKNHLIQAPFCGDIKCEEEIKELSKADADLEPGAPSMGAKSLCIPFQQPAQVGASDKCIRTECKLTPKAYTMFGRSY